MPLNCLLAAASLTPAGLVSIQIPSFIRKLHFSPSIISNLDFSSHNYNIKTLGSYLTTSLHHISNSNTPEILHEPHTLPSPPHSPRKFPEAIPLLYSSAHRSQSTNWPKSLKDPLPVSAPRFLTVLCSRRGFAKSGWIGMAPSYSTIQGSFNGAERVLVQ